MNIATTIPVIFQKLNQYETDDIRFMPVKIWLMHIGENFNGSYFEKSVVEKAIPSLANTPILGYIEDNSNDEEDFSDHRNVLTKDNGRYKIKYIGQAFGVIPESNNAHFEYRVCDDGIEREFLVCDGLIWTKWDEPIDIFNRDIVKKHSMELAENYQGYLDDDNLYHFSFFNFFGACILGEDVQPAMINSTIEQFSCRGLFEDIHNKVEQFKKITSSKISFNDINYNKGGKKMNEVDKLLDKYSISKESLLKVDPKIDFNKISLDELDGKIKEYFALTQRQLIEQFNELSCEQKYSDEWGEWSRYWYFDNTDEFVYFYDCVNNFHIYKFSYSMNGDNVVIDWDSGIKQKYVLEDWDNGVETDFDFKEEFSKRLNVVKEQVTNNFAKEKDNLIKDYESKINDVKTKFETLKKDNETLKEFKLAKEKEERQKAEDALFTQFSSRLSEDELAVFKEKAKDFTIEELEKELFVALGKKAISFSAKPKKDKDIRVKIDNDNLDSNIDKSWVHIVKDYS